jgi:hypothetical protein
MFGQLIRPCRARAKFTGELHRLTGAGGGVDRAANPVRAQGGVSGWRYAGWRGVFYSRGLAQRRELEFISRVNSVEINGSFYSLQRPESFGALVCGRSALQAPSSNEPSA